MIILPDRNILRPKFLPPLPVEQWRTPSRAQPKDQLGHDALTTRFRVRALTHDGLPRWVAWFDDREDFDAFLDAIAWDTLKQQRELWDLPNETWMPGYGWGNVGWRPDLGEGLLYDFATVQFIGSGTSYSVPADCKGVQSGSGEFIDAMGAGGSGAAVSQVSTGKASGAGGGAWSRVTNTPLTPNGSVTIQIGAGGAALNPGANVQSSGNAGTDTWFNGANLAASVVGAKGGGGGVSGGTAAAGGAAASGTGATKRSGGASGAVTNTFGFASSGGGGAAGISADGNASAANSTQSSATAGGAGDGGSGGAGGSAGGATGGGGGTGTEYDGSHGSGGGGGGGFQAAAGAAAGGASGQYGGASGGAACPQSTGATTPAGFQGLIVVSYIPRFSAIVPRRPPMRFFRRSF